MRRVALRVAQSTGPWDSEGQIAQGSMPVLQPVVFTNSAENASLSISVHKDFVCLGKKLIKAVTTQGLPGGTRLPSPEVCKHRLDNRSVGTCCVPCGRIKSFPMTPTDQV